MEIRVKSSIKPREIPGGDLRQRQHRPAGPLRSLRAPEMPWESEGVMECEVNKPGTL